MIEWPRDERITLADLREANRPARFCGASISEINAVRRALSAVKGGRLSTLAQNADQITLIISDTNRGDEATVASGPLCLRPLIALAQGRCGAISTIVTRANPYSVRTG